MLRLDTKLPQLPDGLDDRLEEALAFVLTCPVKWTLVRTPSAGEERVTVRAGHRPPPPARIERPINETYGEGVKECGDLFGAYLAYQVRTAPSPARGYDPLAANVAHVLRMSSGFLEDERLALAVQVESIVRREFEAYGQESAELVAALKAAVGYLEQWQGPDDVRDRVANMVQGMTGCNCRTALRRLAAEGIVRDDHGRAWEQARHPAAHGLSDSKTAREVVVICNLVHQLFVLLVYRIIGFNGQLTDYTVSGWPLRPAAAVAARAARPLHSPPAVGIGGKAEAGPASA